MATNKYPGRCANCGGLVPAGTGDIKKWNGRWVVTHAGGCPEITSGLGIGGVGSDDCSMGTEPAAYRKAPTGGMNFGKQGVRYDEACETCHRETDVCNYCGNCRKHCTC